MPELPECESARRLLDRTIVGQRILEAVIAEDESEPMSLRCRAELLPLPPYQPSTALSTAAGQPPPSTPSIPPPSPEVFVGIAPSALAAALKGRRVMAARRRGKQLWLELDAGPALLVHFGARLNSSCLILSHSLPPAAL